MMYAFGMMGLVVFAGLWFVIGYVCGKDYFEGPDDAY